MAGNDNSKAGQRAGHLFKVASFTAAVVFLVLFSVQEASAYYLLKTPDKNIKSECYYITGNIINLCEGEKVELSKVESIDTSNLTQTEIEKAGKERKQFFDEVDLLLNQEQALENNFKKLTSLMSTIVEKKEKKDKSIKKDIKEALKQIDNIDDEALKLKAGWKKIKIPSRSCVVLREVKQLEIHSVESICRDYREYIEDWSPTVREYYREHLRQKELFDASFNRYLKELKDQAY